MMWSSAWALATIQISMSVICPKVCAYLQFLSVGEIRQQSPRNKIPVHVGSISSGSAFYSEERMWAAGKDERLAGEMEAAAPVHDRGTGKVNALCVLTVTDSRRTGEMATLNSERQGQNR